MKFRPCCIVILFYLLCSSALAQTYDSSYAVRPRGDTIFSAFTLDLKNRKINFGDSLSFSLRAINTIHSPNVHYELFRLKDPEVLLLLKRIAFGRLTLYETLELGPSDRELAAQSNYRDVRYYTLDGGDYDFANDKTLGPILSMNERSQGSWKKYRSLSFIQTTLLVSGIALIGTGSYFLTSESTPTFGLAFMSAGVVIAAANWLPAKRKKKTLIEAIKLFNEL